MPEPYDYTQEDHIREVERALMFIAQAKRKCEQIATALAKENAEPRLVNGLETAASALRAEHNRLLNTSHFPVPDEPPAGAAGKGDETLAESLPAGEGDEPAHDQQRMAL